MGVKNAIMQVSYFLNDAMFNLLFFLSYHVILRLSDFLSEI